MIIPVYISHASASQRWLATQAVDHKRIGVRPSGNGRNCGRTEYELGPEFLEDAVSLQTDWQHTMSRSDQLEILREAMSMLAQMHARGVIQRDIHLGNFLRAGNQLYMIDGGHVERHRNGPLSSGDSIANLAEFFAQFFPQAYQT